MTDEPEPIVDQHGRPARPEQQAEGFLPPVAVETCPNCGAGSNYLKQTYGGRYCSNCRWMETNE